MQTSVYGSISSQRPARLRVGEARSRVRRLAVSAALNELASLRSPAHEAQAFRFLVDVIDSALEAGDVRWCCEFLDALDVTTLSDDAALSPLIGTVIARAALPDARTRYTVRVRSLLARRGWTEAELASAIDDLV